MLDLDHFCTEVREEHGGVGTCEDAGEVDDSDVFERWGHSVRRGGGREAPGGAEDLHGEGEAEHGEMR